MPRSRRSRARTGRSTRLAAESLEQRALLAVASVWLANRMLVIESDNTATQAAVSRSGSDILLQHGTGRDVRINAAWVDVIEFRGGAGNDSFKSTLDATVVRALGNGGDDTLQGGAIGCGLYGGPGNDTLKGGSGNDVVFGGDGDDVIDGGPGDDRIDGEAGHDRLAGGTGHDTIFGGAGDDLLLGGEGDDFLDGGVGDDRLVAGNGIDILAGGEGRDGLISGMGTRQLNGGPGADRFLRLPGIRITDARPEDAVVNFRNESSSWTQDELQVVDEAFAELQSVTGSTKLLKEPRGGGELMFCKVATNPEYLGQNVETPIYRKTWDPYRFKNVTRLVRIDRVINIAEFDEAQADERREAALTVIHEIGHNWDSEDERAAAGVPAESWRAFAAISQWRSARGMGASHVRSGDGREAFAKSASDGFFGSDATATDGRSIRYGQTNVFEDFATSFEEWFRRSLGTRTTNTHRVTGPASATSIPSAGTAVAAAKLASVERLVRAL